jgi:hypothetical protein
VLLVPVGAPLTVAVDDSLFRRAGRKVYGAGWQYDGSSPARDKLSFGTCFVVAGIVVHLPFLARPVCLPVLGRLVPHGGKTGRAAKGGTKTTAGRKKDSAPGSKAERDTDERRKAQTSRVFPAVVGDKPQPPRLIHPYAHNASDLPIYDTQIWYAEPGVGISGPENVGMIMPDGAATAGKVFVFGDALKTITLTFRDAAGVLWVRLPDGYLTEQAGPTPRDSILAARAAANPTGAALPAGKGSS